MRRSILAAFMLAAFVAATLAGSGRAGSTTPACSVATVSNGVVTANGALVPALVDFAVNQGLEAYTSTANGDTGRLVRGKETLVRAYLALPSGCSGTITLSRAVLTATIAGTAHTYTPIAGTGSGSVPATSSATSTVDPVFDLPASDLVPGDGSTTFAVSWSLALTFTQNKGTTAVTQGYSAPPIPATTTFEKKTNALRILVVPMGDASQTFSSQFPSQATTDIQNGMTTLDRIYPVASGVGDLSATATGGIRYTIDTAAMVDLRSVTGAYDTNGRFCGSQTNFDAIKAQLSQFLQTWNAQNTTATADRVVGAIYGGNGSTTFGISDGATNGCADGMAGINTQVAWVRAIDDNTSARPATYSFTGGILAMEIAHTFGLVPATRSTNYHSTNIAADVVTPTGRAYNITSRTYVANNHSVMRYDTSTSAYDNTDTLLEQQDYNDLLCFLTPGAATNPECATTGTVGTSTNVPAGSMLYGSGTTDGTAANTSVVETYYNAGTQPLGQCPGSPLHVQQLKSGTVASDTAICLETLTSDHDAAGGGVHVNSTLGVFSFAVPVPSAGPGDEVRLTYNGTVIYDRQRQTTPPQITSVTTTRELGSVTVTAPTIPPTPDILILADTTGSMTPALQSVQNDLTGSGAIIDTVLATRSNAEFGVANYRDLCDPSTAYTLNQPITSDTTAVQTAVNAWVASGGCDPSEDQLNALYRIATDTTGEGEFVAPAVGWRAGATRIVVWFGDSNGHDPSNGHSLTDVVSALKAAKIQVVAVPVSGTGGNGLETPVFDAALNANVDQPDYIVKQTNGALQPLTDASAVANAILSGLKDLPVTIVPSTSCDDANITLSLGTQTPANPVPSGSSVTYASAVATVAVGASVGTHTCTASFTVNGEPDRALTKTFQFDVSPSVSTVSVAATSAAPNDVRVDLVYLCNGVQYPVAVGLAPTQVNGTVATFTAHFDTTLACGDAAGQLVAYANDGVQRTGSTPAAPPSGAPAQKPPTAAIYVPFAGPFKPGATVPFSGTGKSPQTGELPDADLQWSIDGQGNVASGKVGTFQVPTTPGTYTLRLTATDSVGSGSTTATIVVATPPTISITHAPPGATTTSALTFTVSAEDDPTGLASVACTMDGASVTTTAPSTTPGAPYSAAIGTTDPGVHSVQCTATANDGLAASADDQAQILYGFSGFLAPINNPPTVNTGKAGKTYPVKWQLKDTSGAFVGTLAAVRSIKYKAVSCTSLSSSTDPIETAASGGSALRYDSTANQYVYNWQTPSAPGCYELDVALNDDTTQVADFKLS